MSAITGLSDTNMVLAAAPVAEKARMVFLTSGATSPRVTLEFPNYYFMACFGDNTQAAAGAEYAYSALGAKTAYLLFDDTTDYTVLLAGYFKDRYLQLGGQIVGEDTYTGGATDFSAQIAKIKALETPPDMLYVSSGPDDIGTLVKQLRDAGRRRAYLRRRRLRHASASEDCRRGGERCLLHDPRPLRPDAGNSASKAVHRRTIRRGSARRPRAPLRALGYDALNLVAAAIDRAGSAKQKAIRGALEATRDFAGVTGTISFAPGLHIPEKQVTIVHITGGALTLAAILAPQEVPAP